LAAQREIDVCMSLRSIRASLQAVLETLVPGSDVTMGSVRQKLQLVEDALARQGDEALWEAKKHQQETQGHYLVSASKWAEGVEEIELQRNAAASLLRASGTV
jgi:hypothetical protein